MALRLLGISTLKKAAQLAGPKAQVQIASAAGVHTLDKIGNREIVGHGWNGTACYADRVDYPMPAIRFKGATKEIANLREKEKGDWKKLSLDEKKALYRASFCQTFSELHAPTGEWKMHIGVVMMVAAGAVLGCILMNLFVYQEMPVTFDEEHQKAQLKRILDLEMNPIHGLASKYDYDNKKWK